MSSSTTWPKSLPPQASLYWLRLSSRRFSSAGSRVANQAVTAEVTPYLSCAPGAVAAAKKLARALGPVIDAQTIEMTVTALIAQWESPEAEEGIAAFFGKTAPRWQIG